MNLIPVSRSASHAVKEFLEFLARVSVEFLRVVDNDDHYDDDDHHHHQC